MLLSSVSKNFQQFPPHELSSVKGLRLKSYNTKHHNISPHKQDRTCLDSSNIKFLFARKCGNNVVSSIFFDKCKSLAGLFFLDRGLHILYSLIFRYIFFFSSKICNKFIHSF